MSLINGRGGASGHRIQHIIYDDGGDPARHRAQVQEAIARRRVIAFVQNTETLTGTPSVEFITKSRVPVIGGTTGDPWHYQSPMFFPQAPTGAYAWKMWSAGTEQQLVPRGKTKRGTLFCAEAEQCATADRIWAQEAPGLGFKQVYRTKASIAQPDYTAECLAAQNAGVEFFVVGVDTNSISRLALSCARQGYHPIFSAGLSNVASRQMDAPNLDGMVTTSNVFPWFQSGTPAVQEFEQARQTYGRSVPPGISPATGWSRRSCSRRPSPT